MYKDSAGFTDRLGRLNPRASKSRGPPTNVYHILTLSWTFLTHAHGADITLLPGFCNFSLHSISE
jgi:hypothetical protein